MALLIEPDLQRYGVSGPADNIPVDAPTGRTLLSGQADPRRREPRPTLRPEDTLAGSQSHSESDLGSAFDPTRTVAHAGTQDSTPGSHFAQPDRPIATAPLLVHSRSGGLAPTAACDSLRGDN